MSPKKLSVITALLIMLFGYSNNIFAANAAPPLMVLGPACDQNSKLKNAFLMFLDVNGDGNYDYVVRGTCDGLLQGAIWNHSISAEEPSDRQWGIPGVGQYQANLTYSQCTSGIYSWTLSFVHTITEESVCSISGDCSGVISSTCEVPSMLGSQHNSETFLNLFNPSTKAMNIIEGTSLGSQHNNETFLNLFNPSTKAMDIVGGTSEIIPTSPSIQQPSEQGTVTNPSVE